MLLVWGGSNLQPAYSETAIFNATDLTWTSAAPLIQARSWSGSASSNSRAFAVGGMSLVPFFDPMDSVEMCAPSSRASSLSACLTPAWPSFAGIRLRQIPGHRLPPFRLPRALELPQSATARCTLPPVSACAALKRAQILRRRRSKWKCRLLAAAGKQLGCWPVTASIFFNLVMFLTRVMCICSVAE